MIRITASVANDSLNYEDLYTQLLAVRSSGKIGLLIVDMSAIFFVSADGVLALTCIARLWHRWTKKSVMLQHMQPKVHRYLERMDLFTQCQDWLLQDHVLAEHECFDRKPHSERLLEITWIPSDETSNAEVVGAAVERVRTILNSSTNGRPDSVTRLCTMLSEITQNVIHSQDTGFTIVQSHRKTIGQNSRVVISVADLGIGIEQSLRHSLNPQKLASGVPIRSSSDYIIKALELGVTSRPSAGGLGLAKVHRTVQEWRGILTIRSHQSRVQIHSDSISQNDGLSAVPGTQVTIVVQG